MLSRGICNGIWKIEKSPCRGGRDSLLLIRGSGDCPQQSISYYSTSLTGRTENPKSREKIDVALR